MRASRFFVSVLALLTTLAMMGCTVDADGGGDFVPCSEPAPLLGEPDANAPGYIVVFEEGVDALEEAQRLAGEYPIEVTSVYQNVFLGFHALMSEETVERVRCEPSVATVEHNASGTWGVRAAPARREP